MNFLEKLRAGLQRFMQGRHGIDQLGLALLYLAILLNILSFIPVLRFLGTLALIAIIFAVYRMLSRNSQQRWKENQWWVAKSTPLFTKVKQARVRFQNRKQYRYFTCPKCHAWLRLPRNVGEVTVTCGQCQHSFRKKA